MSRGNRHFYNERPVEGDPPREENYQSPRSFDVIQHSRDFSSTSDISNDFSGLTLNSRDTNAAIPTTYDTYNSHQTFVLDPVYETPIFTSSTGFPQETRSMDQYPLSYDVHSNDLGSFSDTRESVTPLLLTKPDGSGDYYSSQELENASWYNNLTSNQKNSLAMHIDLDGSRWGDHEGRHNTVKEVLRKIGANLHSIIGDPTQFGERETVLGGGHPRDARSLSHICNAYDKNHNLKIYDTTNLSIQNAFIRELGDRHVEFNHGQPLSALGQVNNHDIIIPHPGPYWIDSTLASDINTVLGFQSKAYILTDTLDVQKDNLIANLQQYNLKITSWYAGDTYDQNGNKNISLGDVEITTTQPGPYYIIEVEPETPKKKSPTRTSRVDDRSSSSKKNGSHEKRHKRQSRHSHGKREYTEDW